MDDIFQKIAINTYTVHDMAHRVRILRSYLEMQIFKKYVEADQAPEDQAFINSLGGEFLKQFNSDNIAQIFEAVEKKISQITPLVIYLPFEMPAQEIDRLGLNLRKDFGQNFFYEIKFDPDLIAGCALVWKGIYKDYSLRSTIAQKREEILESFKGHIK